MTTDITELTQPEINDALAQLKQISEYPTPSTQYARVLRRYILALVEALEKAQQHETQASEMAVQLSKRLTAANKRIAELESSTVKLPDDEDGQAYGFGKWANGKLPATAGTMTIAYCEDAWRAAFEVFSSAAGIKVEAE
ncbi:Uncharacterised protein [Klebsiella pneumoniae]|uniref:hypothetical protein n=1 Tax=Klebsiella/Raoultella group TaxID=2890311 RepID=UPI001EF709D9|nr:hypothetical protein [Klebsiella pneumoniae]CAB5620264.1 Uncharacterised protein [Klebsiella pneumoniae]CAC9126151.1 Uncharacterised protein [Klebsiella pneumoniae]HDE1549134.1 hypothetical protein [Klebsiella quasipneumoniae]HDE2014552.1 hypothetical protein [Klebsiella quasipneumoniae]